MLYSVQFLFIKKNLDVAVLVTFLLYSGSLSEPIRTMLNFMKLFEEGKASFIRFMNMIETNLSIIEKDNAVILENVCGDISLKDVCFNYNNSNENILENISLEIKGGETAAIVGSSGIGKTTIASLIARFYDVSSGSIIIDNVDIRDLSLDTIRKNIGIVQQEVYIFNGTIRDNIRYSKIDATDDEIYLASKLANIHDFILSLDNGYDSIVGTRGIMLSGGQRQRISMARLFLKNPKILIMDEATSALDYESEKIIQNNIEKLKENKTCIIIAHRLSTIINADKIFVLSDKKIVEHGKHDELLLNNGEYKKLYDIQNFMK